MMGSQAIRVSQMVLTWGPGAIVETPGGPRVVLSPDLGLVSSVAADPGRFELTCPELNALVSAQTGLEAGKVRIFQVPSNAMVGQPADRWIWDTRPFPRWKLCTGHGVLYSRSCPQCGSQGNPERAVRFIRACRRGHLEDVDWHLVVHGPGSSCRPDHYLWRGGGGSLGEIEITCPLCRRTASLGRAYAQTWPCSGRLPEREPPFSRPATSPCDAPARIVQRQASNLRVAEVVTLFTVPPPYTRIHQVLARPAVRAALEPAARGGILLDPRRPGSLNFRVLEGLLNGLVGSPGSGMTEAEKQEILSCPAREVEQAIRDILDYHPLSGIEELLDREFETFLEGATAGIPPVSDTRPVSRVLLEIDPGRVRRIAVGGGLRLRVTPILRLRTVTVQIGYRRMIDSPAAGFPDLVDVSFRDRAGNSWFPGYESAGEGLFITLDAGDDGFVSFQGPAARRWYEVFCARSGYPPQLFRGGGWRETHPGFVWWHTFSHLLLRAVAVDSGYSLPSVRERVYLAVDETNTLRARGGILLYAVSRGGDGSLGGLLALAPVFERIVNRALETLVVCSSDPLCLDREFRRGELFGAACHACCLISETSCEHRNFWLDRHVLLENLP